MVEALFNKKICKGRVVVENAFALLKQSFKKLEVKTELHLTFVLASTLLYAVHCYTMFS